MLRQIIQSKTNHEIPPSKGRIAELRKGLFRSIVFMALAAMIGWRSLDDGFHFLFQVDKSAISDYESTISRSELWRMNQGTWCLIAITAAAVILTINVVKMIQLSRATPEKEPPDHELKT